jgi:hypothetical protein
MTFLVAGGGAVQWRFHQLSCFSVELAMSMVCVVVRGGEEGEVRNEVGDKLNSGTARTVTAQLKRAELGGRGLDELIYSRQQEACHATRRTGSQVQQRQMRRSKASQVHLARPLFPATPSSKITTQLEDACPLAVSRCGCVRQRFPLA